MAFGKFSTFVPYSGRVPYRMTFTLINQVIICPRSDDNFPSKEIHPLLITIC